MAKKSQIERVTRIIGGAEHAKAPPASAIRKSLSRLRQSISERERQRFSTIAEHAKRREKVDSAIFNLLKADPHTKDIQKNSQEVS